jgi:hypothetical protein
VRRVAGIEVVKILTEITGSTIYDPSGIKLALRKSDRPRESADVKFS